MDIGSVVFLVVMLVLPDHIPLQHEEPVDTLTECWTMAQQLTERAEAGPLRTSGGKFLAGCRVQTNPSLEH